MFLELLGYFKFNEAETTSICELISFIILLNQLQIVEGGQTSRFKVQAGLFLSRICKLVHIRESDFISQFNFTC